MEQILKKKENYSQIRLHEFKKDCKNYMHCFDSLIISKSSFLVALTSGECIRWYYLDLKIDSNPQIFRFIVNIGIKNKQFEELLFCCAFKPLELR